MSGPSSSQCSVELVQQFSSTIKCMRGSTFDCYNIPSPASVYEPIVEGSMWVRGCRGRFRCAGSNATVDCGFRRMAMGRRHNCTCGVPPTGLERVWPSETTTLAALSLVQRSLGTFAPTTLSGHPLRRWLGAIISTNASSSRYAATAAAVASCGFDPVFVPAATPQQFGDYLSMVRELFGMRTRKVIRLSPFELGLVLSHKRALSVIASGDYEWGAVFEDDALLHEAVPPSLASNILARTFAAAGSSTVVYLGACEPRCFDSNESSFAGLPIGLVRGGNCTAYCTHAYAMARSRAATFFAAVFDCEHSAARCGAQCERLPCYSDWAMNRYFASGHPAWVVGGGLHSWNVDHRGLFLQHRPNKGRSTRLRRHFQWPNAMRVAGCNATREAGTQARRLRKLVVAYEWTGRLGNLLFGWAGLIGMAARMRQQLPTMSVEPVAVHLPAIETVPAKELFAQFSLSRFVRVSANVDEPKDLQTVYAEELRQCTACVLTLKESRANAYEATLVHELKTWAANPPSGCELGLVQLVGYFQSFKYFEPYAGSDIHPALAMPKAATVAAADAILADARRGLPPGTKLVGVQVRLGDKVKGFSDHFYAPTGWAYYERAMGHMARTLGALGRRSKHDEQSEAWSAHKQHPVAFVVTSGGSFGGNVNDVATARSHMASFAEHIAFSTAQDPCVSLLLHARHELHLASNLPSPCHPLPRTRYVDLAVLRGCDGLVIGPSSLGWWAAYLSQLPRGRIIAPRRLYNRLHSLQPRHRAEGTKLLRGFDEADYFPKGWLLLENDGNGSAIEVL